jgi:hypothetical protein
MAEAPGQGDGWIVFSGIMLAVAGISDFFNGLYALNKTNTAVDALFFDNNLHNWGWFYVITGIVLFCAGLAVLGRAQWARWVGIIAACAGVILNMFWIFAYPFTAMSLVVLNSLVVYGLTVYGGSESAGYST